MAVYLFGLAATDIAAAVAHEGDIDATSDPTSTQVTAMLTRRAADLAAALYGVGITASQITASNVETLYELCRGKLVGIVSADWLAANQRDEGDYTRRLVAEWLAFLAGLPTQAAHLVESASAGTLIRQSFNDQTIRVALGDDGARRAWVRGEAFY